MVEGRKGFLFFGFGFRVFCFFGVCWSLLGKKNDFSGLMLRRWAHVDLRGALMFCFQKECPVLGSAKTIQLPVMDQPSLIDKCGVTTLEGSACLEGPQLET